METKRVVASKIMQTIEGLLVHDDQQQTPLHHFSVRLSTGSWLTGTVLYNHTNKNGKFTFSLPASEKARTAFIEVIDTPWDKRNSIIPSWRQTVVLKGKITIPPNCTTFNLGTKKIVHWEYMDGWARLKWPEESHLRPDESTLQYKTALIQAAAQPLLAAEILAPNRERPSLKTIKKLFKKNFSSRLESETPGITKTAAFTMTRFFEGFYSPNWRIGPNNSCNAKFNFDKYAFDQENFLPNAEITIALHGNAIPTIEKITLEWRKMFPNESKETYLPTDKEFEWALMAVRNASNVIQQNGEHLGKCHVYLEGYKVAAERNFRCNPVGELFRIFGEGVVSINKEGENIIFGEHGIITDTSALTKESVEEHLKDRLGSLDHRDWKPRKALFDGDKEANISQVWWKVVNEFVEEYFKKHIEVITSDTGWIEVKRFSDDLVAHSAPWYPLEGETDNAVWYDTNEIPYTRVDRAVHQNILKAITPITTKEHSSPLDIAILKNAAAHFIFLATLGHTFKHDVGADECGDPLYSSLSGGGVDPGKDGRVLPARNLAARTLAIVGTLKNFHYGFITKNEDKAIPQEFLSIAEKYRQELKSFGMSLDAIRSRVNI